MTIGLSPVLRLIRPGELLHWCPGCGRGHAIDIHAVSRDGKVVGWDGDIWRPTIGEPVLHEKDGAVCEYLLRAGVLLFFQNCTHALKGQQVPLPDYPMTPPPAGAPP